MFFKTGLHVNPQLENCVESATVLSGICFFFFQKKSHFICFVLCLNDTALIFKDTEDFVKMLEDLVNKFVLL